MASGATQRKVAHELELTLLEMCLQLIQRLDRYAREQLIQFAIDLCDLDDGDADFEPDSDGEDDGTSEPFEVVSFFGGASCAGLGRSLLTDR